MKTRHKKPHIPVERSSLSADGIVCAPLSVEHAQAQHEAIVESAEALGRWMAWYHSDFSVDEARGWAQWCTQAWNEGTHYEFAVLDPQGNYLGSSGLGNINPNALSANLQYWTRTSSSRKGVAASAARLVSHWGVRELGLVRVELLMATANVASRRAAERAGAVLEGVLRNRIRWSDRNYDACLYSFTPEDFE